jgi:hypothetical protein
MAEVETVVGADRDDGRPRRGTVDGGIGDDQHERGRYPAVAVGSTTEGFASWSPERLVDRDERRRPGRTRPTARRRSNGVGSTRPLATSAASRRRRDTRSERTAASTGSSSHSSGGAGLGDRELADRGATQVAQVGATTEQPPEIGGERADVRAGGALDVDRQDTRAPARRSMSNAWIVTGRGGRSTSMPSPRQLVEAPAVDLDRRHHRRHLLDLADEVLGHRLRASSSVTADMSWVR